MFIVLFESWGAWELCCVEVLKMWLHYVGGALRSNNFGDLEVEDIIGVGKGFSDKVKKIRSHLEQLAQVRGVYLSAEIAFSRAAALFTRARESVG